MMDAELQRLLDNSAGFPADAQGPVFKEPWEADTFAMTLSAYQQGLFTWSEWASSLSCAIANAQQAGNKDLGDTYYIHWLTAFENILIEKKVITRDELQTLYAAWDTAARSTPHGKPIEIER